MKILIGTMSYRPQVSGVAVFVGQLADYLIKQGHEIHIVAPAAQLKSFTEKESNGIVIHRLRAFPNPWRKGFFVPLLVRSQARKLVETIKPDVIHVNDPLAMSRFLQRAGDKMGIPTIASNHFTMDYALPHLPAFLHGWARAYLRRWMSGFYNQCDAVAAPSQTVVEVLKKMGVKVRVLALSNGVDLHRFYTFFSPEIIRNRYNLHHQNLLLYVGRIDVDKSVDILLAAFEKVIRRMPAHLVLVGSGAQAEEIIKKTKKNLGDTVTFIGPIAHDSDDLVALYQIADVFVMPSAIETQSIGTLEAMAAGKPIVAANGGALPELVASGQNGFLCKPNDSDDFADKLIHLLKDKKLQEKFGLESLKKVSRHELSTSLSLYVKLYQECRAKRSRA